MQGLAWNCHDDDSSAAASPVIGDLQMDNGTGVKRLTVPALSRGLTWAVESECRARRGNAKRLNETVDIADRVAMTRAGYRQGLEFKRYLRAANEESTPCGNGGSGLGNGARVLERSNGYDAFWEAHWPRERPGSAGQRRMLSSGAHNSFMQGHASPYRMSMMQTARCSPCVTCRPYARGAHGRSADGVRTQITGVKDALK
ncbi:hypothetical protein [Paraburkholderia sp. USG1]|uniref:hypothetical protein n=1 Tax=Paraburkholderia sp. USG1 TaxID=2952268 RepID=UPI002870ABE6|nr:hypothetical protein [Paraburkholderia sp. USG1]